MDRLKRLENEVRDLRAAVSELQRHVGMLHQEQRLRLHPVEALLSQRGLPVLSHGESVQLLLPPNVLAGQKEMFYQLMRRYSFRLFLRDLVQFPKGDNFGVLTRYCSLKSVRSYLKFLSDLGVVEIRPHAGYELIRKQLTSFGPTLEWYVNEIFQREFLAPSLFNIRLHNTEFGGDYDVIAILAGHLVYVEVKSSPPRGVEQPAISAFLNRLRDLEPHMAIFLVDTELRMKDKMVPLFTCAIERENRKPESREIVRMVNEIFHIGHSIYLINSRKGIYSNLRLCVRDFLYWEKKGAAG